MAREFFFPILPTNYLANWFFFQEKEKEKEKEKQEIVFKWCGKKNRTIDDGCIIKYDVKINIK